MKFSSKRNNKLSNEGIRTGFSDADVTYLNRQTNTPRTVIFSSEDLEGEPEDRKYYCVCKSPLTYLKGSNTIWQCSESTTGLLYVSEPSTDSISVIDGNINEVIDRINVCNFPWGIAYNPINDYVYVNCESGKTVSIIDSNTHEIVDTIVISTNPNTGGGSPTGVTVNPYNGYVYSTVGFLDRVAVIDKDTNDVIQSIPVGDSPWSISFNEYNNLIYVGNFNTGTYSSRHGAVIRV